MSDQTARETPTDALDADGLPGAANMTDKPASGSAGKSAPHEHGGEVHATSAAPAKASSRKPIPQAKGGASAAVVHKVQLASAKPSAAAKPAGLDTTKIQGTPRAQLASSSASAAKGKAAAGPGGKGAAADDGPSIEVSVDAEPAAQRSRDEVAMHGANAIGASLADDLPPEDDPEHDVTIPMAPLLDSGAGEHTDGDEALSADDPQPPPRVEVNIRLFGRTDVGQVREHNEDNFIVADLTKASRGLMDTDRYQVVGERGALLGVCDGMGGAAAGEVASQLAVDIIYQRMSAGGPPQDHDELAARLVQAIEAAGLRIFSEAKLDRTRRGMGTTSTIAALMDDHLFLGQVGDSRAYILRGDRLVQVTRDQSLVNQLIEAGQLTEEEAETFEHNNIILQALGTADSVQVDLTYVHLKKGDTLMLCSDGLSGMVRNEEIREVLRTVDDPLETCKVLTDRANQAGGHDNITVVVAKFDGEGLLAPSREEIEGLRYQKYQLPEHLLQAAGAASEPARRVKELEEKKISQRPPSMRSWPAPPEGDDSDVYEDMLERGLGAGSSENRLARPPTAGDDSIQIPTDGAPQWLVIMMIASAVACVTIAGYYLLR